MAHLAKTLLSYLAEGLAPIRPIRIAEVWGSEPKDAARAALDKAKTGPAVFSAYSQPHLPEEYPA
ncbi:hypothetical protein [Thalassovita mangrovi]|uniref:Uncharacterized protein n=1 Tax=Thalassovita mangrovi TaxID=2692236 RepID=A0A6L8LD64_9RHOB|nr:hypothetical protein [Thalassovita mangrovi]MYM53961.1 hypothetical protein [Thalassovita mangrovi]